MAKTLVVHRRGLPRVPFLRGILTRSLQEAGVPFEQAYELASLIRQELSNGGKITTTELRESVLRHLRESFDASVVQRYETPAARSATFLVRNSEGQVTPFSRAQHRRGLESSGLCGEESMAVTANVYEHLLKKGTKELSSGRLGQLTYRYLNRTLGHEAAHRFLVWMDFLHRDRPLLLLIGGTAGCGKSTIATKLANRLEFARIQSTDMLREVMRMMLPARLLPVLHTSSFKAWQALPVQEDAHTDAFALLVEGYRAQAEVLSVACEAAIQRALKERVSLILEGVHLQPSFLERMPKEPPDALVIPVMLAILQPDQLGKRIKVRGKRVPDRRSERYLRHARDIWRLQEYLLGEADRLGIPIVANDDEERAIQQVMRIIIRALEKDFLGDPQEVFLSSSENR